MSQKERPPRTQLARRFHGAVVSPSLMSVKTAGCVVGSVGHAMAAASCAEPAQMSRTGESKPRNALPVTSMPCLDTPANAVHSDGGLEREVQSLKQCVTVTAFCIDEHALWRSSRAVETLVAHHVDAPFSSWEGAEKVELCCAEGPNLMFPSSGGSALTCGPPLAAAGLLAACCAL